MTDTTTTLQPLPKRLRQQRVDKADIAQLEAWLAEAKAENRKTAVEMCDKALVKRQHAQNKKSMEASYKAFQARHKAAEPAPPPSTADTVQPVSVAGEAAPTPQQATPAKCIHGVELWVDCDACDQQMAAEAARSKAILDAQDKEAAAAQIYEGVPPQQAAPKVAPVPGANVNIASETEQTSPVSIEPQAGPGVGLEPIVPPEAPSPITLGLPKRIGGKMLKDASVAQLQAWLDEAKAVRKDAQAARLSSELESRSCDEKTGLPAPTEASGAGVASEQSVVTDADSRDRSAKPSVGPSAPLVPTAEVNELRTALSKLGAEAAKLRADLRILDTCRVTHDSQIERLAGRIEELFAGRALNTQRCSNIEERLDKIESMLRMRQIPPSSEQVKI